MAFTITNPFNVTDAGNLELDGARHVATAVVGGTTYLFTTGSDDSGVSVFSMAADGTLTNVHNVPDNGTLRLGGAFGVATAVVDGTTYVIASGLNDSGLSVFSVGADGSLTNTDNVGDTVALQLGSAVDVQTAVVGGTTYVFAAGNTDHGISVFSLGTNGTLTNVDNVNDVESAAFRLSGVQGMTTAVVGGTTYLFAAGFHDSGVSVFSVGTDGVLTNAANVVDNATLELGGAVGVTTAVVGGTTYLFVAGFGDDGVSVFSVGTNGTLTNVDNVTDAGALELDNAIYMTTAVVGGTTYLFVTGSDDDGMSVFSVGTDGHLTSVTNVVDNATLELDRAYRPTTVTVGGNTFVVVPGQHDDGLSVFRVFDDSNTAPTADAVGPINGSEDSGARVAITLSGNDTDAADAVESFRIQTLAANGQLFDAATGGNLLGVGSVIPASGAGPWTATVYFQPNADFNGGTSFTYSAFDGVANSTAAAAAITVTAQADTVADDLTASEGSAITANVLTGTNGASADTFEGAAVLSNVTNGANGTVGFDAVGNVTYTPDADFFGTDTFTYTVTSGGVTETGTVNVTVTEVNDAPVAGDDAPSAVDEDSGTRVIAIADLIANDLEGPTNEAAQALDIINVGNAFGGTVQINGGNIEFTLDPNFNGTASFDYTLQDNGTTNGDPDPLTAGGHVSFAVSPINDAPTFVPGVDVILVNEDDGAVSTAWASDMLAGPADESGQALNFDITLTGTTGNLAFIAMPAVDPLTGALSFEAAGNTNGTATVEVTLVDDGAKTPPHMGESLTQILTIVVNAVNDAPEFSDLNNVLNIDEGDGPTVLEEDAELSDLELDAADSYAGATLTLQRQGGPSADDVFGATGILAFNGSDVVVGTTTVGTLTNAGGVLTITFDADATADLVDEVLQHITYRNTSDAPPAQFAIAYTFSDGNTGAQGSGGARTASGSITVNIEAVNDDPAATGVPSDIIVTENVASNLDLSAITLTDPDSGDEDITLTLTASAGILAATSGAGVAVGGTGTGVLTLTGAVADLDAFLNVASNIQYTLNAAGDDVATVTLTANDGGNTGTGGGGNVALGTVNIDSDGVNDDPTATGVPSDVTVAEDVASNLDLSAITLTDPDSGASPITLTLAATAGILAAVGGGGVTVGGSGTGTLTLTGAVANIDAFLNGAGNIQYTTALDQNGDNVANIDLTANDGGNTGTGGGDDVALGSVNIDATAVNDNPGGNLAGGAILYLENQAPTALDPTLTVTDADDTHLEGATVQITANFAAGQDVLGFVNQNGITGNYHAGTGLLTLTGHATLAQYEAALRSVTYFNSSDTPATIARNVHFAVDDGGGLTNFGDVGVNLTGVNDTPVLADVPASTSYGRGEPAVVLAAGATVADLDTPTLDGATVRITNVQAGDVLDAEPGGTNILTAYDPVTGMLTLSGTDTLAHYQQVLATVMFATTGPGASRTLEWQLDDGEAAGSLSTVVTSQITLGDTARNDFNADGRSDLFWRDDVGVLVLWDMDGATVTGNHVLSAAMPDPSRVLDIADFDGDGRNDVLWQNQAGAMVLWEIDGATITSEAVVASTPLPSYWHYEGTGDFTGDGNSDILWRDDAGVIVLWEMDGATVTGNRLIGNLGTDWHVAEIADFNGDTRSDILWRHDDGTVRLWEMDGSTVIGDTTLGTFAAYWEIVDSGDYNGDGNADLLWRDDAGVVVMWELNGPAILDNTVVATVPAAMQLVNSGDYNGDGNADLLWRDGATVSLWEMDGPNVLAETNVATIPTYWHIQ